MRRAPGGWNLDDPSERENGLRAIAARVATTPPRRKPGRTPKSYVPAPPPPPPPDMRPELGQALDALGIPRQDWLGGRSKNTAAIRAAVIQVLRAKGYTFIDIGNIVGIHHTVAMHHTYKRPAVHLSPSMVLSQCVDDLAITPDQWNEICGRGRNKDIVKLRWRLWKAMHDIGLSYPEIARLTCRPNHSSVVGGVKMLSQQALVNPVNCKRVQAA